MSYKVEVIADSSGKWVANGVRFATIQEAQEAARDLYRRWTLVEAYRVVSSDDPVTDVWIGGRAHAIDSPTVKTPVAV